MATSFEEILATHCLSERYLDRICSEEHRDELAKRMKDWKAVGAVLEFTRIKLDMMDSAGFINEEQKRTTLLRQWSVREKENATYLNLAKSLFAGGLVDLFQELCGLVPGATPTTPAGQYIIHVNLLSLCSYYLVPRTSKSVCIYNTYAHQAFRPLLFLGPNQLYFWRKFVNFEIRGRFNYVLSGWG